MNTVVKAIGRGVVTALYFRSFFWILMVKISSY